MRQAKIAELFVYDNFSRVPVDEVAAGDICALSGIADIKIGETITQRENPVPLPTIQVRGSGFHRQRGLSMEKDQALSNVHACTRRLESLTRLN